MWIERSMAFLQRHSLIGDRMSAHYSPSGDAKWEHVLKVEPLLHGPQITHARPRGWGGKAGWGSAFGTR